MFDKILAISFRLISYILAPDLESAISLRSPDFFWCGMTFQDRSLDASDFSAHLKKKKCIYLAASGLSCGTRDLSLRCVGFSLVVARGL